MVAYNPCKVSFKPYKRRGWCSNLRMSQVDGWPTIMTIQTGIELSLLSRLRLMRKTSSPMKHFRVLHGWFGFVTFSNVLHIFLLGYNFRCCDVFILSVYY